MPLINEKPSLTYVAKTGAVIAPQSVAAAGNPLSSWVDSATLNKWAKVISLAGAGAGTFALKIQQATSAAGANAKDLITAAVLGITAQAAASVVQVDVPLDEGLLDLANGFRWIQLNATCTGGAGTFYAAVLELGPSAWSA